MAEPFSLLVRSESRWIGTSTAAATNKEFARFLDISIKSANETEHHLLTPRDSSLLSPQEWQKQTGETVEIRKMIYTYRKRVLASSRDSR